MKAVVSVGLPGRENVVINYSRVKGVQEEKRDGERRLKNKHSRMGITL